MDYDGLDFSFFSTDCYHMKWINELNWNGIIILEDLMIVAISAVYILYHYSCGCTCLYSFCCQTSPLKNYQTYVEEWIESNALAGRHAVRGHQSSVHPRLQRGELLSQVPMSVCYVNVPQFSMPFENFGIKIIEVNPFRPGLHNWEACAQNCVYQWTSSNCQ